MKRIKRIFYKHWNVLPWFCTGLFILIDGNIGRFTYGITWGSVMVLLWIYCPTVNFKSLEEKSNE